MPRMTKAEKIRIKAEHDARNAEQVAIVQAGKCPQCGAGIRRNNSMTGWFQCKQLGAEGFREDASKPSCSWQTFIDVPRR